MSTVIEQFKNILIQEGYITESQWEALWHQHQKERGSLTELLLQEGVLSEESLLKICAAIFNTPPLDLSRFRLDPDLMSLIPMETARRYHVIPLSQLGRRLTVAVADPFDLWLLDDIKTLTGMEIAPVVARPSQIKEALDQWQAHAAAHTLKDVLQEIQMTEGAQAVEENDTTQDDQTVLSDQAPIIRMADSIIRRAVEAGASDLFIEPLERTTRVRCRIDGIIREIETIPKNMHLPLVSRFKVISHLDISERRLPQDGRFRMLMGKDREIDFRVSVMPTALGEKVVLRILDSQTQMLSLDQLGFQAEALARLKDCAQRPHGMILSCGPTGSGKTTTLYSILKELHTPEKNIVTVEDPVEFQIPGMNQVNVQPHFGLTFATALRSILRQDPDIILIGEIRERETLDIAIKAALTGHLVISSLHTTTAAGSVVRMMNMGVEPFMICSAVLCVVGQRLVRRICPKCRQAYQPPQELLDRLGLAERQGTVSFYRGKGCDHCLHSGYKGRIIIAEVMLLTPVLKEAILARENESCLKKIARQEGMMTMREDGLAKALQGNTTLEEVLRVTAPDEPLEGGPSSLSGRGDE